MSPEALQLKSQESHKRRRLIQRQKRQLEFKARASLSLDRKTNEGVLRDIQKAFLKCCTSESQSFKAEIIKTLVEMEESYCDVTDKSTEDDKQQYANTIMKAVGDHAKRYQERDVQFGMTTTLW